MDSVQLMAAMPGLPLHRAEEFLDPLNRALKEFQITTPPRVAAFFAQIGHESGSLRYWREIWGPTAQQRRYDPPGALAVALGNTEKGDGFRFRGRGPIQITGRANYETFSAKLGLDLLAHPELLELPEEGFRAAGLFWQSRELNRLADQDTDESFEKITRRINGGTNGLADRIKRWELARRAVGLQ